MYVPQKLIKVSFPTLFHVKTHTLGIDIRGYSHRATLNVNNIPLNFDRRTRGDPTLEGFDLLMSLKTE